MKRRLASILLALLLLALGLVGCAQRTDAPQVESSPASFQFSAADTPAPASAPPAPPTPTFTPAPTPTPDALTAYDGRYTIAWISDTQHYSAKFPDVYYEMTQFLYAERARLNLQYIVHTGDLVHNWDVNAQWLIADGAMNELGDIPYGVLAGNHDVNDEKADDTYYKQYFGEARFRDMPWYGESYGDNRCHYDLIDAGNTQYIFVYAGYPVTPDALAWASDAFAAFPDRVGFLCVHDYLERGGARSAQGDMILERVVRGNPNVYFVLCGHNYDALCLTAQIDDGGARNRTVYQLLNNYQAAGDEGGSGYMRFLQVDEARGTISMYTYSPLMRDYVYYDEPGTQQEKYAFDPDDETLLLPIPWTP